MVALALLALRRPRHNLRWSAARLGRLAAAAARAAWDARAAALGPCSALSAARARLSGLYHGAHAYHRSSCSGRAGFDTCLAHPLQRYQRVEISALPAASASGRDGGAPARVLPELRRQFPAWADRLGDDHGARRRRAGPGSADPLTRDMAFRMEEGGLPNTFVPGRNLVFRRWLRRVPTGAPAGDRHRRLRNRFLRLPDCRDDTMKALQVALARHGPAPADRDAADVARQGADLGAGPATRRCPACHGAKPALVDLIVEHSHTCYLGDREHRHDWGWGCGTCPGCGCAPAAGSAGGLVHRPP